MTHSIPGKCALITGAGSGINLAFARLLLQNGCSVLIGDLQVGDEAKGLLREYPHPSSDGRPSVLFQRTDVTSWPQLSTLWKTALDAFHRIDIVVPGAGIFDPPWSSFWEPPVTKTNTDSRSRDPADAEPGHYAVFDINLVAPIRLSQLAIGYWTQEKRAGCLVHVGSVAGYITGPLCPLYYASKHGLHGFVRSLRGLRDQIGVRVACVAPGNVQTSIWSHDAARSESILLDCAWTPVEEIAQAMLELVVNEEYGNGTILEVTKGRTRIVPDAEQPTYEGYAMPGGARFVKSLYEDLKSRGLRV